MNYFLVYLFIGMVYAGLTFKKTIKFISQGLSEEEKELMKRSKETDELKVKLLIIFLVAVFFTFVKIPLYPMVIFAGLSRKSK